MIKHSSLNQLSYLIVDDDQRSRRILQTIIEKSIGSHLVYTIDNSANFIWGLEKIETRPNVIFFDLMMEPFSGFDLLEQLRNAPQYNECIAIAVTARAMSHDIEKMKEAGFQGLISKPIVRKVFPELLKRIVLNGESIWYVA